MKKCLLSAILPSWRWGYLVLVAICVGLFLMMAAGTAALLGSLTMAHVFLSGAAVSLLIVFFDDYIRALIRVFRRSTNN